MTPDQLNPDICPSALEEDGTLDRSKWDGAHVWDGKNCAECGAEKTLDKCEHCGKEQSKSTTFYCEHCGKPMISRI